jgi:tetratricopeptide (TPR) repeat protein
MNIPEYLQRADQAIQQGEFDMANRYYQQILKHNPANLDALEGIKTLEVRKAQKQWSAITIWVMFIYAWFMKLTGKPQNAYPTLELIYHCNPSNTRRAMVFANCAIQCNKREKAHEVYSQILTQNYSYIPALRADANLLIAMDNLLEAKERFEQLNKLIPNNEKIVHSLRDVSARAYSKFGIPERLTDRRAQMERALREAPGTPDFVRKLNLLLEQFERDTSDIRVAIALSEHYRSGKLFDDANRILSPVIDAHPNHKEARLEQARIWKHSGELAIAVSLYKELSAEDPDNQKLKDEFLEAQIQVQVHQQDSPESTKVERVGDLQHERDMNQIQMLKEHIHVRPESTDERVKLGELYLKYDRVDDAITVLQRLIHEPSWAGKGYLLIGQCFRCKGDHQLAISQFEKALPYLRMKNHSNMPTEDIKLTHYSIGLCKEDLKDWNGAREAFGQVYSVDIHYKDVRDRYENTFKQSGESQTS